MPKEVTYEGITWTNAGEDKKMKGPGEWELGDENPYHSNSHFVWTGSWGTMNGFFTEWVEKSKLTPEILDMIREHQGWSKEKSEAEKEAERIAFEEELMRLEKETEEYAVWLAEQPPTYCYKDGTLEEWEEMHGISTSVS